MLYQIHLLLLSTYRICLIHFTIYQIQHNLDEHYTTNCITRPKSSQRSLPQRFLNCIWKERYNCAPGEAMAGLQFGRESLPMMGLEDHELDQSQRNSLFHLCRELESKHQLLKLAHKVPIFQLDQLCNTRLNLHHLGFYIYYDQPQYRVRVSSHRCYCNVNEYYVIPNLGKSFQIWSCFGFLCNLFHLDQRDLHWLLMIRR